MVVVNAWHEYVNDTCGSGIVSCAADVPGMSVVRGTKGDGCSMYYLYCNGFIIKNFPV